MLVIVMRRELKTLVNPLGSLAGGKHDHSDQQQAQQQSIQVFTRKDSPDEFHKPTIHL
jgi:hypothetical protein